MNRSQESGVRSQKSGVAIFVGWVEERNPTSPRGLMLGFAIAQPNLQLTQTGI